MNNVKEEDGNWPHVVQKWVFTKDDIDQVKQFVFDNGVGNSRKYSALEWFLNLFQSCRRS